MPAEVESSHRKQGENTLGPERIFQDGVSSCRGDHSGAHVRRTFPMYVSSVSGRNHLLRKGKLTIRTIPLS